LWYDTGKVVKRGDINCDKNLKIVFNGIRYRDRDRDKIWREQHNKSVTY